MEGDVRFALVLLLLAIGSGARGFSHGSWGADHVGAVSEVDKAAASITGLIQSSNVKVGGFAQFGNNFIGHLVKPESIFYSGLAAKHSLWQSPSKPVSLHSLVHVGNSLSMFGLTGSGSFMSALAASRAWKFLCQCPDLRAWAAQSRCRVAYTLALQCYYGPSCGWHSRWVWKKIIATRTHETLDSS